MTAPIQTYERCGDRLNLGEGGEHVCALPTGHEGMHEDVWEARETQPTFTVVRWQHVDVPRSGVALDFQSRTADNEVKA